MKKQVIKTFVRWRLLVLGALFLGPSVGAMAGEFRYHCDLDSVPQTGFYRVPLSPKVTVRLNARFSDVRLLDASGVQAPYIYKQANRSDCQTVFVPYEILEKKHLQSYRKHWRNCTAITVHNPQKTEINNLSMRVKNVAVKKQLELSGSDDGKQWYAIQNNYTFNGAYNTSETQVLQIIGFPRSDYEYYRIVISDQDADPMNVVQVGYQQKTCENGSYQQVPSPKITLDTASTPEVTIYRIEFGGLPYAHRLHFQVTGPDYFHRRAELGIVEMREAPRRRKHRRRRSRKKLPKVAHWTVKESLYLTSNQDNFMDLSRLEDRVIYLRIYNDDNAPLTLTGLTAYQLKHYVIAYLEAGKKYQLTFGDWKARAPKYDLNHFSNTLPDEIPVLQYGNIQTHATEAKRKIDDLTTNQVLIWAGIGTMVLLLGGLALKMANGLNKEEEQKPKS